MPREFRFHYFSAKIDSNFKWKTNFLFALKIPEIIQTSIFIVIKKVKTVSTLQIPQWKSQSWKIRKLMLALNISLKSPIYSEISPSKC